MAIFNLGSINADLSYSVDVLPEPGETISAHSVSRGLGGKGTNMSVAAARARGLVSERQQPWGGGGGALRARVRLRGDSRSR